jgi:hypothetical protein
MESTLPMEVESEDLSRFVKAFSRDDTFTVLYLLTKAEVPRTLEDLCRRYGGSVGEIKDRLDRLTLLGLVGRRGRGYIASAKAIAAMRWLEERLGKAALPTATATEAVTHAPLYVANAASATPLQARTNNGRTLSCWWVTTASGAEAPPLTTEPVNESCATSVVNIPEQPNATRSQLYM